MSVIERPIYDLLQKEPFFANFLLGSKIVLNDPTVPTAGACVIKGQVHFVINTEWLSALPREEQCSVLKHEVFHVLLDHCTSRMHYGGKLNKMAKNYAMDCAINQHITPLPSMCVSLQAMEELTKRKLKPFECWEYYYEQLKDQCEKDGNVQYVSNHDYMDQESDGTPRPVGEGEEAINKIAVKDAASKAIAASAGLIPDSLSSILANLNRQEARLPWKQILRNFVANARSTKNIPTRLRANRRFDLDQPGTKKERKLVLGVCTDSSGSVSDEAYAMFMQEIHTIAKSTTTTYLVHADCEVQKVDVIKGGKAKGDVLKTRHGAGGTAYQPAITECLKRKCDAIIYFGDMDAADKPKDPGIPVLWVRVGSSEPPATFGKVLDLK